MNFNVWPTFDLNWYNSAVNIWYLIEKLTNFSSSSSHHIFQFLITAVGATFLITLFGEIAPKIYAKINNIRFISFMARPLKFLMWLVHPVSSILVGWTNIIERRFSHRTLNSNTASKEEIGEAIDASSFSMDDRKTLIEAVRSQMSSMLGLTNS